MPGNAGGAKGPDFWYATHLSFRHLIRKTIKDRIRDERNKAGGFFTLRGRNAPRPMPPLPPPPPPRR
jgi:hypothetical protein